MAAVPLSFDFPDSADVDITQRMKVPQKITISDVPEENSMKRPNAEASTAETSEVFDRNKMTSSSMAVPERIVINGGFAARRDDFPRELQDDRLPTAGLGAMTTPPRTLTVDNTVTAHYPQSRPTISARNDLELERNSKGDNLRIDNESISAGLDMIGEMNLHGSDSDEHMMVDEMTDLRKSIVKLKARVINLERECNRAPGFWSKAFFFAFTIINPMILHWLFWRRR